MKKIYCLLLFAFLSFQKNELSAQINLLQDYQNNHSAYIGSFKGINFREGGFSGLFPIAGTNGKEFWTCSDRGVNVDCANANPTGCKPTYDKMYCFPTYSPKIHRIRINADSIQILQSITIKNPAGKPATGLINPTGFGSTATEVPSIDTVQDCANFISKTVEKDTFGIDAEGIGVDKNGTFWICEEGGATIWKINQNGILQQRYSPYANLAGASSVDVQIDTVFKYRKNNRGFEGIAITPNGKIYSLIQSPILFPDKSTGEGSRIHRILEIDPITNATKMFAYLNDGIIGSSGANQIRLRDWKIGDMTAINDTTFLVIEQALRGTSDFKKIYLININQATPINSGLYNGKTIEALVDSAGLESAGIKPVKKQLFMDLLANGWPSVYEKAEGISIINDSTIAICIDNDYGQVSPKEDGIPIATNINSHLLVYGLMNANKIPNFKASKTTLNQGITGPSSSQSPYLTPSGPKVKFTSILSAGDDGYGYKMVGIPDGSGAFDNEDGTFTMLLNHEIPAASGSVRSHGSTGAFVSRWVINKTDLSVIRGSDLINNVKLWNGTSYDTYNNSNPSPLAAFNRLCSADLAEASAFYNSATGLGTQEKIFLSGEEAGNEGRVFAHIASGTEDGTSYELPYLGKFSWENAVACPEPSNKTIVMGMDDSTPGQLYAYVGTKTNTGTNIDKAGLSKGNLYGIAVEGLPTEISASTPIANTKFTLVDLGDVSKTTGADLNTKSNSLLVTNFLRPEDGTWDPEHHNNFYFVTTNAFTAPSRLWKLSFTDIQNPALGGTVSVLLNGTEGQKMLDNICMDHYGNILMQEDPGNQTHLAKVWQYNIHSNKLTQIATHDSTRFNTGAANFLTQDEESSGIIDVQNILGAGHFLLVDQTHYSIPGELYEGGQILSLFNPDTYNASLSAGPNSSDAPYLMGLAPEVKYSSILTAGDDINGYKMAGLPDGTGAFDNHDGTFTFLVNHELGSTAGVARAHGSKGAFVSKWIINKNDLTIKSGSDLIRNLNLWNGTGYTTYNAANPSTLASLNRLCSADLPPVSAFYNITNGNGTQERIFMNGEEAGNEGRAFAHIASGPNSGVSYELPKLGKFSWENAVACPTTGDKTFIAGLDDSTPGQVYFYSGTKTNQGNEIERAGLTNGILYGLAVTGLTSEVSGTIPAANSPFTLIDLGDVSAISGADLNTKSNTLGVTSFLRPEDGAWDPSNPQDFYFATTNAFNAPSRLWRCRFTDVNRWEIGGTITAVLDGSEGQRMIDNITIDNSGHIILQEDPGNQTHIAKMWQYNIQTDALTLIGQHLPTKFLAGINTDDYLTQDEESSGIIDAQEILGSGMFLFVDQAHYALPGEVVEGGQLLTMYNPSTDKSNPEIEIYGNNKNIITGDITPSLDDNTDFGSLKMGLTLSKTFQINNTGLGYLNITEINIVGADAGDFVIENKPTLPLTINGNASQNLTLSFKPTKIGTRNAKLVLKNTDFNEQQFMFQIAGEGLMSTSTNDSKLNMDQFQFTPNPFNQYLNLNFKLNSNEVMSCNIQDINGKLINNPFTNKHFQAGNNLEIINTSTLAPGMYIIELISGNTKFQFKLAKVF